MEGLVAARALPDGSFEYGTAAPDALDRLRNGDPTLGWVGDEHLDLVLNTVLHRWEVWYTLDNGESSLAMHCPHKPGQGLPITTLIHAITAHDTRHVDVVGEAIKANETVERERTARFREETGEAGEKLAHALAKDLDMPAPDGKVFPLSGPR